MTKGTKIILAALAVFILYVLYVMSPSDELASFEKLRTAGEINQNVKVKVLHAKGYNQDARGNILGFLAADRNGEEATVQLQEPAPAGFQNADIVEILGHMHGSNFVAKRATIVK